ncbi:hypothetical protein JCM30197_21510 [Schleiferia thermophila]|nr:hypothetical protein JCM30197_21510 [Schleiferia thermophila]
MYNNTIILSFTPLYLMAKNKFNEYKRNQNRFTISEVIKRLRLKGRQVEILTVVFSISLNS